MSETYGTHRITETDEFIDIMSLIDGRGVEIPHAEWREIVLGWAAHYARLDEDARADREAP